MLVEKGNRRSIPPDVRHLHYTSPGAGLCSHIGFAHEGTLRKSRPHEGSRFDSVVMGILAAEYAKRADTSAEAHPV